MNADIVETYRQYLECCNGRRLAGLSEFLQDPVRLNGKSKTLSGYVSALTSTIEAVPDLRWEIQDLVVGEDALAVRLSVSGTPQRPWLGFEPTGQPVTTEEYAFYGFREGRIEAVRFLYGVPTPEPGAA
ncbi:ester cyclase [Streptomyces mirabilis]|uniref:ester cyclase n=1 Tax=Streptomyces mirabilis TaxID=68239 RepID=UPI0036846D05